MLVFTGAFFSYKLALACCLRGENSTMQRGASSLPSHSLQASCIKTMATSIKIERVAGP